MKALIAKLLADVCKRQMAYNSNQRKRIDDALSYEMKNMPIHMVAERNATRESAFGMRYLHTQSYFIWSDRLKRVQTWANS